MHTASNINGYCASDIKQLIQLSHARSIESRKARKHLLVCHVRFAQSRKESKSFLLGWSLFLVFRTLSLNIIFCRCVSMMWFYCTGLHGQSKKNAAKPSLHIPCALGWGKIECIGGTRQWAFGPVSFCTWAEN